MLQNVILSNLFANKLRKLNKQKRNITCRKKGKVRKKEKKRKEKKRKEKKRKEMKRNEKKRKRPSCF
jgi:hypothetical protein